MTVECRVSSSSMRRARAMVTYHWSVLNPVASPLSDHDPAIV